MASKTPAVIITGYLGSGKTTLLQRLIESSKQRLAILLNEFGELAIDSRIVSGKNIKIAELAGGCVCCSLVGEFEAAVKEIIETIRPDEIIVETTGLAEPDALLLDIQENIPDLLIDAVVTVVDADATFRFPSIGHTGRVQMEMADLILLNKVDLVTKEQLRSVYDVVKAIQPKALLLETVRCQVDPRMIFGEFPQTAREIPKPHSVHVPSMESFQVNLDQTLDRNCFEKMVRMLPDQIYRAKGFIQIKEGKFLFNYVAGRQELVPFLENGDTLGIVFIGEGISSQKTKISAELEACVVDKEKGRLAG